MRLCQCLMLDTVRISVGKTSYKSSLHLFVCFNQPHILADVGKLHSLLVYRLICCTYCKLPSIALANSCIDKTEEPVNKHTITPVNNPHSTITGFVKRRDEHRKHDMIKLHVYLLIKVGHPDITVEALGQVLVHHCHLNLSRHHFLSPPLSPRH